MAVLSYADYFVVGARTGYVAFDGDVFRVCYRKICGQLFRECVELLTIEIFRSALKVEFASFRSDTEIVWHIGSRARHRRIGFLGGFQVDFLVVSVADSKGIEPSLRRELLSLLPYVEI